MNHLQGFGLFFLLGGIIGVCGGIEQVFRKRSKARRAVAVTARIVNVESDGGAEPGELTHYYPVVTFTAGGRPVRVKLLQPSIREGEYRSGKMIRVYYDPCDPTQVVAICGTSRAAGWRRSWVRCSRRSVRVCVGWDGIPEVEMVTPDIQLRPVTIADLDLLRCWDEQPHALASDPNDERGGRRS